MARPHPHDHHDADRYRCHFPSSGTTATSATQSSNRFSRARVLSGQHALSNGATQARWTLDACLSAWAVLLHKYIGIENVSFVVFREHTPLDVDELKEGLPLAKRWAGCADVEIVRYRVLKTGTLHDVHEVSRDPWRADETQKGISINTAVVCSEPTAPTGRPSEVDGRDQREDAAIDLGYCDENLFQIHGVRRLSLVCKVTLLAQYTSKSRKGSHHQNKVYLSFKAAFVLYC